MAGVCWASELGDTSKRSMRSLGRYDLLSHCLSEYHNISTIVPSRFPEIL